MLQTDSLRRIADGEHHLFFFVPAWIRLYRSLEALVAVFGWASWRLSRLHHRDPRATLLALSGHFEPVDIDCNVSSVVVPPLMILRKSSFGLSAQVMETSTAGTTPYHSQHTLTLPFSRGGCPGLVTLLDWSDEPFHQWRRIMKRPRKSRKLANSGTWAVL